jgi:HlyD family secretion protein
MSATPGKPRRGRRVIMIALAFVAGVAGWALHTAVAPQTAADSNSATADTVADTSPDSNLVTALGRLQPKDGVIRVAGPSQTSVVIAKLLVDKGDRVQAGQVIATLDNLATSKADLERVQVELEHAKSEYERLDKLYQSKVVSVSERDNWRMKANMLEAERQHAQVELDLASVRAPISGQVLDIHTRPGEKVEPDGIVELGQTDQMYAVAEVYETDIGRVHVGQRASISSRALPKPVEGTVERIGLKIGKADTLGVDPIAKTDARVVEVEIRLDNSKDVNTLTNAQVEVAIAP